MFASYALLGLVFFYCHYGQRCFGTARDAETFQKHYHISSISLGSNVPRAPSVPNRDTTKSPTNKGFCDGRFMQPPHDVDYFFTYWLLNLLDICGERRATAFPHKIRRPDRA